MNRIKRGWAAVLCLLLALGGCASAQQPGVLDMAQQVLEQLTAEEYAQIVARFDETMAQAVDEQALEGVWGDVTMLYGGVTGVQDAQADEASRSAVLTLAHERGRMSLVLAFDEKDRIAGMYLSPLAEAAPQAMERALPQGVTAQPVALFAGSEKELAGELLIPAGADETTAYVVLVHGSGPSDLDARIGGNKPFRDLGYDLAALGVGSLRFDKVTFAHPELPCETVDDEYLIPVAQALAVLRQETNAQRAYLVGHSQGGMLAPYLVSACDFDGGVSLAGTPKQLWELSYAQNLALLESMGDHPQREQLHAQVEAQRELALRLCDMADEEAAATAVFGASAVYQRHLARMDQAQIAKESGKPFLFLWGESDFQVDRAAFDAWRERLGDDARYAYKTYPGLNHLFMPAGEDDSIANAQAAYQELKAVDAQVAADIAAWIAEQTAHE